MPARHPSIAFESMSQAQNIALIAPTIDERQRLSGDEQIYSDSLSQEQWKKRAPGRGCLGYFSGMTNYLGYMGIISWTMKFQDPGVKQPV